MVVKLTFTLPLFKDRSTSCTFTPGIIGCSLCDNAYVPADSFFCLPNLHTMKYLACHLACPCAVIVWTVDEMLFAVCLQCFSNECSHETGSESASEQQEIETFLQMLCLCPSSHVCIMKGASVMNRIEMKVRAKLLQRWTAALSDSPLIQSS